MDFGSGNRKLRNKLTIKVIKKTSEKQIKLKIHGGMTVYNIVNKYNY